MIIGRIEDLARHKDILPAPILRALDALKEINLHEIAPGRYELEGDQMYYLVEDATPRSVNECSAEAHHSYADIQIPVGSRERFGFSLPQAGLVPSEELFPERDIAFYPSPANEFFMDLVPGAYAVFLPGELHRPCVEINDRKTFRKVVVKVHSSLLGL